VILANDDLLHAAYEHWRKIGYSAQSAMALALAKHTIHPSWGSIRDLQIAADVYRQINTNMRAEDLV